MGLGERAMPESPARFDTDRLLEELKDQHLLGSLASDDLNVNLLAFTNGSGIEEHTNTEADVLLVVMEGEGVLTVDGEEMHLTAGQVTIIPKGATRSIRADSKRFAYLTCHGRRTGLMPKVR